MNVAERSGEKKPLIRSSKGPENVRSIYLFAIVAIACAKTAAATPPLDKSPREICLGVLALPPESLEALDPDLRQAQLITLAEHVTKSHGAAAKAVADAARDLAKADAKALDYSARMEALAIKLNRLSLAGAKPTPVAQEVDRLWQNYPSPESRTAHEIGRSEACIEAPDPRFQAYTAELVPLLVKLFGEFPATKDLTSRIGKVPLLPAGTKSFFAATVTMDAKRVNRLCINPDEAPPLQLVRLMHEYAHAINEPLAELKKQYQDRFDAWVKAQNGLAVRNEKLQEQWESFFDGLDIGIDDVTDDLQGLSEKNQNEVLERLASQVADAAPSDFLLNPMALGEMSASLTEWVKEMARVEALQLELIKTRENLDLERYLDEHRAYAIDYLAGRALVAAHSDYFCRLWVPSYRYKRPIPFYRIFEELETTLNDRTFSEWLAVKYTFESKSYLPTSLFVDGQRAGGLKPEVKAQSEALLAELIPGWKKTR